MRAKQLIAPLVALLMVASVAAPAASAASAASTTAQDEAYAGTNVSFDVNGSAIADYAVRGDTVMESITVQSQSEAESSGGIGVGGDLGAVADLPGAALSLDVQAETRATVTAESGAELRAHDNSRGIAVVEANGESQYVLANLSAASNAESEGDGRVTVTTENGTTGTFVVVGDGEVAVNDEGDVAAELDEDARLVFRAYEGERDDEDERHERMIANGTAAAEVHVMERGGEAVADTVHYGSDTTVEVTERTEGAVTMTAERAEHEGTVVITTVSESALDARDDLEVTVDGEAAAQASSYSDLRSAIGGDESKFMVRQASDASAGADVLVAVNHFSEREITMTSGDAESTDPSGTTADDGGTTDTDASEETTDAEDPTATSTGQPGFGVTVALGALAIVGALGAFRRR